MSRNKGRPLPDTELRYWPTETEALGDGEQRHIGGLFAPYGTPSRMLPGGFVEVITPSAIRKSIADGLDIISRLEHDPRYLLGTTESKTLEISDDPNVGASYRVLLPNTMAGRDAWALVKTGRLNHSSMGFMCFPGGDEWARQGSTVVRHLVSVRLTEASPVSQPGYIETETAVRHLAGQLGEDPADVLALAQSGELRALFTRTDQMVSATPAIEPGSAPVDPALAAAMAKNRQSAFDANRPGRLELDRLRQKNEQRRRTLELELKISQNRANSVPVAVETRSSDDFPRDRYGNARDWHPWQH